MARVRRTQDGISFKCPGCGDVHAIPTSGSPSWGWNESLDSPTLAPSIDVKSGHFTPHWKKGDPCWCKKNYGFSCYRCHSHVVEGRISFCGDSSHALAGQTVDMFEIDDT